jgi:2-phospho-L-lactate guanylyltransferase
MAEDVLDALDAARHLLAGILVVTADAQAAALARRRSAQVFIEPSPAGINRALARAAEWLSGDEDCGLIIVPADLPHITADTIDTLTRHLAAPRAVALIAATGDGGTNVLAVRPAGIIRPSFGPDSFARHCAAARAAGITPAVLALPHLGCDIDRPGDLETFLSLRTATRTHAFLACRGLSQRLASARHPTGTQYLRFMR